MSDASGTTSENLIAAAGIRGAHVYDLAGHRLGHVDAIMLDKHSGRAVYVLVSFGAAGAQADALPWTRLTHDTRLDGYVVDLDRRQLEAAMAHDDEAAFACVQDNFGDIDTTGTNPSYRM